MPRFLLGLELPLEAEAALRILPNLSALEQVIQAVVDHLKGESMDSLGFLQLQRATSLDERSLGALFTGIDWIIRTCMRSSLKTKALVTELTDLKVASESIGPIISAVEQGCADHLHQ